MAMRTISTPDGEPITVPDLVVEPAALDGGVEDAGGREGGEVSPERPASPEEAGA
jgi:hypothetical protein